MRGILGISSKGLVVVAALGSLPALLAAGRTEPPDEGFRRAAAAGARSQAAVEPDLVLGDSLARRFAARYRIPFSLAGIIHRAALREGVEPALVFALIDKESGFDPRAVGPRGSIGLMQIKPSTARIYDRRVTRAQLLRPDVNVRLGLRHLREEVEHFGDDLRLGLLAYNMGRTRLSRILHSGRTPRSGYAASILARCEELCT